jgi:hypothetical protein
MDSRMDRSRQMIDQPGLYCWFQSRDLRVGVVLAIDGKGLNVARWEMIGR